MTVINKRIILDLCGGSGSWSKPYKEAGYDVRLVTLPDNDVKTYIPPNNVWGVLAAPPCTEFSFAKHYHGKGNYTHDFASGLAIADACIRIIEFAYPKWWVLENPRGYLRRWYGKPVMTWNPWQFGESYQKKTDLWGSFVSPVPTVINKPNNLIKFSLLKSHEIAPEYSYLNRQERRAITPRGFATAFFKANP